jgi:N-acetylglucosaminyl-diphospho-decaprenol L-rhamnosyltransferase
MKKVTISIVSHNHGPLVKTLLDQLCLCHEHIARTIVTFNAQEKIKITQHDYPFETYLLYNNTPKGFGANHNQAFSYCDSEYFCVMNPDIFVSEDPFPTLLPYISERNIAIIAPMIVNMNGGIEYNARYFPTPWGLVKKVFGCYDGVYPRRDKQSLEFPDWIAGMFMLIDSKSYAALSGFDEAYFLYYEDVDLCARAWKAGMVVALCQEVSVVHDARRSSHKDLRYFKWHIASIARFFLKHAMRFPNR